MSERFGLWKMDEVDARANHFGGNVVARFLEEQGESGCCSREWQSKVRTRQAARKAEDKGSYCLAGNNLYAISSVLLEWHENKLSDSSLIKRTVRYCPDMQTTSPLTRLYLTARSIGHPPSDALWLARIADTLHAGLLPIVPPHLDTLGARLNASYILDLASR